MGKQGQRRKRPKRTRPCQNGDACYNPVCKFAHPSGQERKGLICKSGNDCYNRHCKYFHPLGLKRPGLFTKLVSQKSSLVTDWNLNDPTALQNDLTTIPKQFPSTLSDYKSMISKCLRCEMFSQLRIDTLGLLFQNDNKISADFDSLVGDVLLLKTENPALELCKRMCAENGIDIVKKNPIDSWRKYCIKASIKFEAPDIVKVLPAGSLWVVTEYGILPQGEQLPNHIILKVDASSKHLTGRLKRQKIPIAFSVPKSIPEFLQKSTLLLTPIKNLQCFSRVTDALDKLTTFQPMVRHALIANQRHLGMAENLQSYVSKQFQNYLASRVNQSQLHAIKVALKSAITNLIGPPGSGKSTTAVELLRTLLVAIRAKRGHKLAHLAVCAPSNQAVDVLFERSEGKMVSPDGESHFMPFIVRIGNEENFSAGVRGNSQSVHILTRDIMQLTWLKGGRKKPEYELQPLLEQIQLEIDDLENQKDDQMLSIQTRIAKLKARAAAISVSMEARFINQAKREITKVFFEHAEIVFSTVNGLGSIKGTREFDCVLIDECCQLLEYESLIALQNASRVVNIGDPYQLRPTVLYHGPRRELLLPSLAERLQNQFPSPMLAFQYRMHPEISMFPSRYFYQGRLQNGENVLHYQKSFYSRVQPYQVVHVPGTELRVGTSLLNMEEVFAAQKIVEILLPFAGEISSVGIITPYLEQKAKLINALYFPNLRVDTVDAFQGSECDVIILSCVRGGKENTNIGFLADPNRILVLLSN